MVNLNHQAGGGYVVVLDTVLVKTSEKAELYCHYSTPTRKDWCEMGTLVRNRERQFARNREKHFARIYWS